MKTIGKNRKEDLKLLIDLGENYHGEDVTFTFSAGRYGVEKYVCSYINGESVNLVVNGTAMLCLLDNHRLPLGTLSVEIDIRVPDTQMPDGDFRHVTRKAAAFTIGGEQCTVELTNGASDYFPEELVPEAVINLLPTVIKGDPGQDADIEGCNQAIAAMVALTGEVETAEIKRAEAEQQRMDSEADRTAAENERKAAENERAKAETQRQAAETLRTGAENTRTEAEKTRITKEAERTNAETARQTAESLRKSKEAKRTESETARNEAEKARAAAETSRSQAETQRANAEKQRIDNENERKEAEAERAKAEALRANNETARSNAETQRAEAERQRAAAEAARQTAESSRDEAETTRQQNETERTQAETQRAAAEIERTKAEDSRKQKESERQTAEQERITNNEKCVTATNTALTAAQKATTAANNAMQVAATAEATIAKSEKAASDAAAAVETANTALTAAQKATTAANNAMQVAATAEATIAKSEKAASDAAAAVETANSALSAAEDATTAANNATKNATTAAGEANAAAERANTAANLVYNGNPVTTYIHITTDVVGVDVSGLPLVVWFDDNKDTAITVTTDDSGTASFDSRPLTKFCVTYPKLPECQDLPQTIGFVGIASRTYEIKYSALPTALEQLTLRVYKWTGTTSERFANCTVHVTIAGETIDYLTDSNGEVQLEIPYGTEYIVAIDEIEGLYTYGNIYQWTYIAGATRRLRVFNYRDVMVGMFYVCKDGTEYLYDEFVASGRNIADAVMIKVVTADLAKTNNVFGVDIDSIANGVYINNKMQWCVQNKEFTTVPMGMTADGLEHTVNIDNESKTYAVATPAATYCLSKVFAIGDIELQGFLGAVQQKYALTANEKELNTMLAYVRPDAAYSFSKFFDTQTWTSDQDSSVYAYLYSRSASNGSKSNSNAVEPFYAF